MSAPFTLVAISAAPDVVRETPVGWASSWSGDLAVRLADGALVRVGERLMSIAAPAYSGSHVSETVVELRATDGGWLVHIVSLSGDAFDVKREIAARWLGSPDGRVWRRLAPTAPITDSPVEDTLTCPPPDDRLVLSPT